MPLSDAPIYGQGQVLKCPTCGNSVRITYRNGGYADRYKPVHPYELHGDAYVFNKPDPRVQKWLRAQRNGKKTVALVGTAPLTCALAPYDEPTVKYGGVLEIWGLNEEHYWEWFTKWTRWIQIHTKESFTRPVAKRNVIGHYEWLKEPRGLPIYMQFRYPEIPDSVEYPLMEIVNKYLPKVRHGDRITKYFTNSLAYMIALALYEGFQRIEIYGFEMAATEEFMQQKANAEFWMGIATGRGVDIYVPEECSLLTGPLYGYQGQGPRNLMEGSHYDDDKQGYFEVPDGGSGRTAQEETILARLRNPTSPSGTKGNNRSSRRRRKH